jgi:2-dehydro-3-deoxy-D-arabinonate dehydratase
VFVTEEPLSADTMIRLNIIRAGSTVFEGSVAINQIVRKFEDLVSFLYRECSFPSGSLLMTGTGIVPDGDFTLNRGDSIQISIDPVGMLVNTVD